MIDALLFSVRDNLRSAGFGYDEATSEITDADGHPPARMKGAFCAVHQLEDYAEGDGRLDEWYAWGLTLTQSVNVPKDRVGDKLLAAKLARQRGPTGAPSFNARCEQLRSFFHMDWGTLQDANTLLVNWSPDVVVYGFCEPARYRGRTRPRFEGPDWFAGEETTEGDDRVVLVSTLRFEDCRRMQALETFT